VEEFEVDTEHFMKKLIIKKKPNKKSNYDLGLLLLSFYFVIFSLICESEYIFLSYKINLSYVLVVDLHFNHSILSFFIRG